MRYKKALEKPGVFVPFVMLGDPCYEVSFSVVKTLIDLEVDALELGFAFSDPIADGAAIQASHVRALRAGVSMRANFAWLAKIRAYNAHIPIGLLVYANLVHRFGIEDFYRACLENGVDSVLVADVPLFESAPFLQSAQKHRIAPIFIAAPHTSPTHLEQIARLSHAYIYVLARAGVTGTQECLQRGAKEVIAQLRTHGNTPCLLGFGISKPEHAQVALQMGAQGVIVGSALVQILQAHLDDVETMLARLRIFVQHMRAGLCYN
ncbi:tryptophan synthase subunit alpha [Helicobacter labacensis]|uniref:tryptophan synthase subunit alpha n=1 Tax=Helicobacter labacensis TaxID=2316079 RepID=UPI000EAB90A7|nr:tryptophan synthase subunit alpha [Helicobacter labacensis]